MLVKAIKDFTNLTNSYKFHKNDLFVVYAIELDGGREQLYVYPFNKQIADGEYDPLPFPIDYFEAVCDRFSNTWEAHTVKLSGRIVGYKSFPEWFKDDFYIRAHDWNLDGDDYGVINKYKQRYEEAYRGCMTSHNAF